MLRLIIYVRRESTYLWYSGVFNNFSYFWTNQMWEKLDNAHGGPRHLSTIPLKEPNLFKMLSQWLVFVLIFFFWLNNFNESLIVEWWTISVIQGLSFVTYNFSKRGFQNYNFAMKTLFHWNLITTLQQFWEYFWCGSS